MDEDDEFENQMSLAAIEAELKPKVVETFDKIASEYKKLRRLQEQDIQNQLESGPQGPLAVAGAQVQEAEGRDRRRGEVAAPQSGAHRSWSSSSTTSTRSWCPMKAACCASAMPWRRPRRLPEELSGLGARSALAQPRLETRRQGLEEFRRGGEGPHQGTAPEHSGAGG
jgi:hypothetical protein